MKKRTSFTHLRVLSRDRIHALYGNGHTQKDIAEVLGVSPSTISRELGRNGRKTWRYNATRAEADAKEKRTHSKGDGMKVEAHPDLKKRIIKELKELRAPDEIAGRMKMEKLPVRIGTNALYKWLYSEYGKPYCKYLCSRRVHKKKQSRLSKRHLIPNRISLRERPTDEKQVHGESDLFVSPTNLHSKTVGHMTVVPRAHLLTGQLIANKKPSVMVASMKSIQKKLAVTTWTMDNGTENQWHEQFGIPTYFCTPGSPWQKPHVESSIGLTRKWFLPKGTDLAKVPNETFQSMLFVLNHKYRKSLGYRSAYEVALECDIIKKVPLLSRRKAIAFR
jgi:transposase, IS30 family